MPAAAAPTCSAPPAPERIGGSHRLGGCFGQHAGSRPGVQALKCRAPACSRPCLRRVCAEISAGLGLTPVLPSLPLPCPPVGHRPGELRSPGAAFGSSSRQQLAGSRSQSQPRGNSATHQSSSRLPTAALQLPTICCCLSAIHRHGSCNHGAAVPGCLSPSSPPRPCHCPSPCHLQAAAAGDTNAIAAATAVAAASGNSQALAQAAAQATAQGANAQVGVGLGQGEAQGSAVPGTPPSKPEWQGSRAQPCCRWRPLQPPALLPACSPPLPARSA
jgi:hypothetical protein